MNSKELFTNIFFILDKTGVQLPGKADASRKLHVHVGRASAGAISHITTEFEGAKAKFFCCTVFDGSGDAGCSVSTFSMPKVALTQGQRALLFLSVAEYLTSNGYLSANFEYFKERTAASINGGVGNLLAHYDRIRAKTRATHGAELAAA